MAAVMLGHLSAALVLLGVLYLGFAHGFSWWLDGIASVALVMWAFTTDHWTDNKEGITLVRAQVELTKARTRLTAAKAQRLEQELRRL